MCQDADKKADELLLKELEELVIRIEKANPEHAEGVVTIIETCAAVLDHLPVYIIGLDKDMCVKFANRLLRHESGMEDNTLRDNMSQYVEFIYPAEDEIKKIMGSMKNSDFRKLSALINIRNKEASSRGEYRYDQSNTSFHLILTRLRTNVSEYLILFSPLPSS